MISKSSERHAKLKQNHIDRCLEKGRDPTDYVNVLDEWERISQEKEADPEWAKNNLEYDLRSTDWILNKVRSSDDYAGALYSALCNNDFIKREMWQILKEDTWGCSWRYAGGIVADMKEHGDYIDWYCHGNEGYVSEEIKEDLYELGWIVVTNGE